MIDGGFVVEDDVDERGLAAAVYETYRHSKTYHLMIFPTYDCNLRCWYCTQHHSETYLNVDGIERVKRHITSYLIENKLEGLHISWFGGEPLMAFDAITEIGKFAQQFCKNHGLTFKQTITTNGTLLSRDKILSMLKTDFRFMQVTIDGDRTSHNAVKKCSGASSYDSILNNLCLAVRLLPDCEFVLRFNYTGTNIASNLFVKDMNALIPKRLRAKIDISLKKVWQVNELDIDKSQLEHLRETLIDSGYLLRDNDLSAPCYVDAIHFNTIFPDTSVDKCDNRDPEASRGRLMEDGHIEWRGTIPFIKNTAYSESSSDCIRCKFLPVCNGPCPDTRERMLCNTGKVHCDRSCAKGYWEQVILRHCQNLTKSSVVR